MNATDTSLEPDAAETHSAWKHNTERVVNQIAYAIGGALGTGDVAELRRLHPKDPSAPAFWKVAALYLTPSGMLPSAGQRLDDAERRWASILNAMAQLAGLHRPARRLGHALAAGKFSELRFVRLLRAHDKTLFDNVRTAAGYLAAKAEHVDCADIAQLVLSDGRSHSEAVRRRIARDYYGSMKPE